MCIFVLLNGYIHKNDFFMAYSDCSHSSHQVILTERTVILTTWLSFLTNLLVNNDSRTFHSDGTDMFSVLLRDELQSLSKLQAFASDPVCGDISWGSRVCALRWVKYREHISLLVILCIIVYVTNKAHLSLIFELIVLSNANIKNDSRNALKKTTEKYCNLL